MLELNVKKKLNNFTLEINCSLDSNRIGILGGSGAGKSMILKMIAGIEKPDSGYIKLDGKLLFDSQKKIDIKPQDRHIGYCFQNYALFPHLSVYENIIIGLDNKSKSLADDFLEKFGLTQIKDAKPNRISGGQAARVAMARILIRKPKVLLFDEAFSALDIYLRDHIQEEIASILDDFDGSAVFVSHSRDEIYRLCESMIVIDSGKITNLGNTKEIFKNPKTKNAAILTGCKNISDIRYIDDNTLEALDWGVKLNFSRKLTKGISAIGIRAHDFHPVWGKSEGNIFEFRLKSKAKLPFEDNYYIKTCGGQDITWLVQRDMKELIEKKGLPDFLKVDEKDILLLK